MSNDGGPAFPFASNDGHCLNESGMSLRDYFAAKAMAAMVSEPPWCDGAESMASRNGNREYGEMIMFADAAYKLADAMLAARARP